MTLNNQRVRCEADEWLLKHAKFNRYEITETEDVFIIVRQSAKKRIQHEEQSRLQGKSKNETPQTT